MNSPHPAAAKWAQHNNLATCCWIGASKPCIKYGSERTVSCRSACIQVDGCDHEDFGNHLTLCCHPFYLAVHVYVAAGSLGGAERAAAIAAAAAQGLPAPLRPTKELYQEKSLNLTGEILLCN